LTESLSRQNFVVHPHLLSSYDPIITYANFVYDPREASSSSRIPSTNFTPSITSVRRGTPSNLLHRLSVLRKRRKTILSTVIREPQLRVLSVLNLTVDRVDSTGLVVQRRYDVGWKVIESEKCFSIFRRLNCFRILSLIFINKEIESFFSFFFSFCHPGIMQVAFSFLILSNTLPVLCIQTFKGGFYHIPGERSRIP